MTWTKGREVCHHRRRSGKNPLSRSCRLYHWTKFSEMVISIRLTLSAVSAAWGSAEDDGIRYLLKIHQVHGIHEIAPRLPLRRCNNIINNNNNNREGIKINPKAPTTKTKTTKTALLSGTTSMSSWMATLSKIAPSLLLPPLLL